MNSRYRIRKGTADDADTLLELMCEYCSETYRVKVEPSAERLRLDLAKNEGRLSFVLAEAPDGRAVGFSSWCLKYDWHWTVWGSEHGDLFVTKPNRGSGLALQLLVATFAWAKADGAVYLQTFAVDAGLGKKLCRRVAKPDEGLQYTFGGKLFTEIATTGAESCADIVRKLDHYEKD